MATATLRIFRRSPIMSMWKSKTRLWLALFLSLGLALAPAMAEARAGRSFGSFGANFGSRGLRYAPSPPMSPSVTPQLGYGYGGGSFFQRHPFLTGLGGGFIGSWLFSRLGWAGPGYYGHSAFGTLFELLLIGGLIWLAFRWIRGRAFYGGGAGWPAAMMPAAAGGARYGRDINLDDADLGAFQQLHAAIQEAWSAGDLGRLRQMMTPQMLGYFSDELTKNASQGVQNIVSGVQLEKGELTEAWEEGDLQYATAAMRWRARDYVVRLGSGTGNSGQIVSGDPRAPVEAEEMWTFVRRRGGRWLLSAIQQV
jgi:hypothetical protein